MLFQISQINDIVIKIGIINTPKQLLLSFFLISSAVGIFYQSFFCRKRGNMGFA